MQVTEPEDAQRYAVLYQATIDHAISGAPDLMARLVAHARAALRDMEGRAHDRREVARLTGSRRQLNQCEADAIARFSEELKAAFARIASREQTLAVGAGQPHFAQIASMDAAQVEQSVEIARVRHAVQIAADQALAELNALICTLLGLEQVQLERNPLRPAVYVDAVTSALSQMPVPAVVRQGWISLMSGALGQELDVYYRQLCTDLRDRGVGAIKSAGGAAIAGPSVVEPLPDRKAVTFERLRALLGRAPARNALHGSNEYQPPTEPAPLEPSDTLAQEDGPVGFRATVPAAFEAARDMNQLEQVAQRLEERDEAGAATQGEQTSQREQLRQAAHGLDQALALEVVAMMVDNIRHDPRLLPPVQNLVSQLEPALLRLALVDPQFFSHKQHPARRLLHEITHRSIAFESQDSRGFSGFMDPLHEAVAPLADDTITSAVSFDQALARLVSAWDEPVGREQRQIAKAVLALQQAEQRAVLAQIMVRDVLQRPEAVQVPSAILDFICGPWAQVVAHARIADSTGADDPGHFAGLIDALMWSAQPALTQQDPSALRQMVPDLLHKLQLGLASIGYPAEQVAGFFLALEQQHQRGLDTQAFADTELVDPDAPDFSASVARWTEADSSWLAPAEARASGFIDMLIEEESNPGDKRADPLVLGAWVALMVEGNWSRTRLAWTSANGSLLLFSDALGFIQSLSRRACEQLFANGQLRVITNDPVEDALDAVAQTALNNSVDVEF